MESNVFDRRPGRTLAAILDESEGQTYFVSPTVEVLDELVSVARSYEGELPPIRILTSGPVVREVMDDFLVASEAAELVADGAVAIRTRESTDGPTNSIVVTEDAVLALVRTNSCVAGITATGDEFVDDARATYIEAYDAADPFQLRTPPISEVRETLTSEMGTETGRDFSEVLSSLETARGNGDGLDEVTISLLVGAKNEELFYDISRWGEDAGIASKATFSRVKNRLEDNGLIETWKVPGDVGRPRQRLVIADDRLETATTDQIASVAESILN